MFMRTIQYWLPLSPSPKFCSKTLQKGLTGKYFYRHPIWAEVTDASQHYSWKWLGTVISHELRNLTTDRCFWQPFSTCVHQTLPHLIPVPVLLFQPHLHRRHYGLVIRLNSFYLASAADYSAQRTVLPNSSRFMPLVSVERTAFYDERPPNIPLPDILRFSCHVLSILSNSIRVYSQHSENIPH